MGCDVMTIRSFKSEGKAVPSSDCTVLCVCVCTARDTYVREVPRRQVALCTVRTSRKQLGCITV